MRSLLHRASVVTSVLIVGIYRDTVIVEDRAGSGSLQVSVELRIYQ